MSTRRPRSFSSDAGIGLPVSSEIFIRNWSVHSRPIGIGKVGISWFQVPSMYLALFSSCQGWSRSVVRALGASLTSSWVVPPAYMRNWPSAGVSRTSSGSDRNVNGTSISVSIRLMTRKLPR